MPPKKLSGSQSPSDKKSWEILFKLPNGAALTYTFPGDKQPWRTADTRRARSWEHPEKHLNLNIHGWVKGSNQNLVFLDFDDLPEGFHSFDALYEFFSNIFKKTGITFRSYSNHVKIAVIVETPEGCPMTDDIARDTARAILPYDLFNFLDQSGFKTSFSNRKITKLFNKKLSKLKPIPAILDSVDLDLLNSNDLDFEDIDFASIQEESGSRCHAFGDLTCRHTPYELYEGEIDPCLMIGHSPRIIKLIRFLLRSRQLVSRFDISQEKLGCTLEVHQRTAGRYLKKLVKLGFLVCVDPSFKANRKAMTYRAVGPLLGVLQRLYPVKSKFELPTSIENRTWNATLLSASTKHFWNRPEEFLKWVKSIPGWDKKDRWDQAKRLAKRNIAIQEAAGIDSGTDGRH